MNPTTQVRESALAKFASIPLLPLVWLERTRGRRRLALLVLYSIVVLVLVAFIWRATSLNGLPDVGDPFDVAAFAAYTVPPAEDAFTFYDKASSQLHESNQTQHGNRMWGVVHSGWSKADPVFHAWVGQNRAALLLWRQGSEQSRAMPVAPANLKLFVDESNRRTDHMQAFTYLALLEGSHLEESGDLAGAWVWYNAVFRASRHMGMHAPDNYRSLGTWMYELTADRVRSWSSDPRLSAVTLRRAITDIQEIRAMTAPNSEMVKADYLALMWALDNPRRWIGRSDSQYWLANEYPRLYTLVEYFKREPDRSRRVARIIFAHWLADVDKPSQARPIMFKSQTIGLESYPNFPYYTAPGTKDRAHPLPPDEVFKCLRSTLYASHYAYNFPIYIPTLDTERHLQSTLLVTFAEQLYLREHGALPDKSDDLVRAGYLKQIPLEFMEQEPNPAMTPN